MSLNLLRLEETLSEAWLRLNRVTIEHLDWKSCITRYDRATTLFYLDPPYWQTLDYGVPFELTEYVAMAELAHRSRGKMIISVNDHPEMHRIFSGLEITDVKTTYTVGIKNTHQAGELIISNFKPSASK